MISAKRLNGSLIVILLFVMILEAAAPAGLVDAVKRADKTTVVALLKQKVDVNTPEADGTTALHWAARMEDLETAEMLLRAGANVKAENRFGVTPLSVACINGNAAIIEMLLKAGADANTVVAEGETALMTASRSGNVSAVKMLLAHGADVNAKEGWRGQTALMWAAAEGDPEVIKTLVGAGADIRIRSKKGFSAFLFAVREGKIDAVRALLDAGANVDETVPLPPPPRRQAGGASAEPVFGPTALILATENAHYELAALLLDRGADPNSLAGGRTALHEITWVRKAGTGSVNPAPQGSGNMDSLEFVRKLVNHGANVNARITKRPTLDENVLMTSLNLIAATPFLLASRTADVELMRLLIELGADPLLPNADNTTPLIVAAGVGTSLPGEAPGTESEVLEAVKLTLEMGGDVNAVDNNGETAMHGAAYKFVPSVVHFLAENGAKIEVWNQKNKKGFTPLNIAEGIVRIGCLLPSPVTEAAIRQVMNAAIAAKTAKPQ